MNKEILKSIRSNKKLIKKNNFENLFKLMIDYQLTTMFGKKGFKLKEHIDFVLDIVTENETQPYLDYIRKNTLTSSEPEKYITAVQLILSSIERYLWFWTEDHFPRDLLKNLLGISEIFNKFRDKMTLEKFENNLKLSGAAQAESDKIVEENRFFLHKKTREIKDYFESVLESTTDAVISTDLNGKIVLFNSGAANMFGYEPEQVFHKDITFLYENPEEAGSLKNALIEGKGKVHSFESFLITRDKSRFPTLISASLLQDRKGTPAGVVRYIKDITQIKELERELRELSAFKSKHLHNISHELKTPISTILGFIEIITKYYDDTLDINVQRYMDKIRSTSQMLLDLMDTLLDIAKIESGKLELNLTAFNPVDILNEVKIIFLPLLSEKGVDFSTTNNTSVKQITADKARVRQIVFNLISNAVKHTEEKGKIKLTVSNTDNNIHYLIEDKGKGIPRKDIDKIFDEFVQLDGKVISGTGLGLPLSKHLTELHGGKISVDSQLGRGSIFTVALPLKAEKADS